MQPGALGSQAPLGDDWMVRELASLRGDVQSLRSSVAGLGAISQQIDFLTGQVESANVSGSWLESTSANVLTSLNWEAFNASQDAAVSVRTGVTGRLAIQGGANMWASVTGNAQSYVTIGFEILDSVAAVVRAPMAGDGGDRQARSVGAAGNDIFSLVAAGLSLVVDLAPSTDYVVRCRRGSWWEVDVGGYAAVASTLTSLTVTKLGM